MLFTKLSDSVCHFTLLIDDDDDDAYDDDDDNDNNNNGLSTLKAFTSE